MERLILSGFREAMRGSCASLLSPGCLDSWEWPARSAPRGRKAMRSTEATPVQLEFLPASECESRDWKDRRSRCHPHAPPDTDSAIRPYLECSDIWKDPV